MRTTNADLSDGYSQVWLPAASDRQRKLSTVDVNVTTSQTVYRLIESFTIPACYVTGGVFRVRARVYLQSTPPGAVRYQLRISEEVASSLGEETYPSFPPPWYPGYEQMSVDTNIAVKGGDVVELWAFSYSGAQDYRINHIEICCDDTDLPRYLENVPWGDWP